MILKFKNDWSRETDLRDQCLLETQLDVISLHEGYIQYTYRKGVQCILKMPSSSRKTSPKQKAELLHLHIVYNVFAFSMSDMQCDVDIKYFGLQIYTKQEILSYNNFADNSRIFMILAAYITAIFSGLYPAGAAWWLLLREAIPF